MSHTVATSAGRHRVEAPAPSAARPSWGRRIGHWAANGVLLVCVLAFFGIALGPHLFGYRTATMLTGSMEPGIMPGDVVVTVPKPTSELKVGDVISYQIPIEDHRVETHRVTKIVRGKDGSTTIVTKGDNNPNVDPWTATLSDDTVWEARAVVPKLGTAIRVLRTPAVRHGVFWFAFGGLILLGLTLIWGKEEQGAEGGDDPTDADGDTDGDTDGDADGTDSDDDHAQPRHEHEEVFAA